MYGKTIKEAQQELAENLGFGQEVIWDLLRSEQSSVMKQKIEQLIPDREKGMETIKELRDAIFTSVWNQRKYSNGTSVTSIFYVMVANVDSIWEDLLYSTKKYTCHPVFRCRKCLNDADTRGCCMIYVDENGRVYQNWKSFVAENVLPTGIMITPRKGIYNFNNRKEVILDTYRTPNSTLEAKALTAVQRSSAVLGVGAACVPIASLILPVAAPIVATAGFVGLCVGAFTSVRSIQNLKDRDKHEQSISLTNREARANYLGVVGGAVGVAAVGATRVMTSMAAAGKATKGIEFLVNGMNISSIVLSGSGAAHGVLDLIFKYNDGDTITSMDILQLSSSLVLFTHSVYNFQLASQIANNARNNSIRVYRETLSNRQRKKFDKISEETMRIRGETQGRIDIIRGVNEIPDRQHLNDLFKINKNLNRKNVRLGTDTNTLNNLDPENENITKLLINFGGHITNFGAFLLRNYGEKFMANISDGKKCKDVIEEMAANFSEKTSEFLMKLAQDFIENSLQEITKRLKLFIPTETVLFRIIKYVLYAFHDFSYEFISQKGPQIKEYVKTFLYTLDPNPSWTYLRRCPDCNGHFYARS